MAKRNKGLLWLVPAAAVVLAVAVVSTMASGEPRLAGSWEMIRIDSQYGYAYLYNTDTGDVWMVQGEHKQRVVEDPQPMAHPAPR